MIIGLCITGYAVGMFVAASSLSVLRETDENAKSAVHLGEKIDER